MRPSRDAHGGRGVCRSPCSPPSGARAPSGEDPGRVRRHNAVCANWFRLDVIPRPPSAAITRRARPGEPGHRGPNGLPEGGVDPRRQVARRGRRRAAGGREPVEACRGTVRVEGAPGLASRSGPPGARLRAPRTPRRCRRRRPPARAPAAALLGHAGPLLCRTGSSLGIDLPQGLVEGPGPCWRGRGRRARAPRRGDRGRHAGRPAPRRRSPRRGARRAGLLRARRGARGAAWRRRSPAECAGPRPCGPTARRRLSGALAQDEAVHQPHGRPRGVAHAPAPSVPVPFVPVPSERAPMSGRLTPRGTVASCGPGPRSAFTAAGSAFECARVARVIRSTNTP